jgi:hypothetical protein
LLSNRQFGILKANQYGLIPEKSFEKKTIILVQKVLRKLFLDRFVNGDYARAQITTMKKRKSTTIRLP